MLDLEAIKRSVDWQLKALQTDSIDFGFIHCIDEETDLDAALARDHYANLGGKASACLACGHCNRRCPFHVDQMARMRQIADYFGA